MPFPSGSAESTLILKVLPTAAVPLIEKDAFPLSTNGILLIDVFTISSKPWTSL